MHDMMTAPARRCQLEEVFARPFIELIGLAPCNPVVRGLILSQTGRLPEPERATFEQLKEWVETTCAPRAVGPQAKAETAIAIKVEFSDTEYGRASYSVPRAGTGEFELEAEEVLKLVQAAIDEEEGVNHVVDQLAELINSEAWDRCEPNLDDSGDYEYENHDPGDTENSRLEFSRTQVREKLLGYLRERHPGLLEELA